MHTLFDFITHTNGMEYVLALLFIGGFIVFLELFRPQPFVRLVAAAREDYHHIKAQGKVGNLQFVKKVVTGGFLAVMYLASLPFLFMRGIGQAVAGFAGTLAQPGWSPVRAYFTGRRKGKKSEKTEEMAQEPEGSE